MTYQDDARRWFSAFDLEDPKPAEEGGDEPDGDDEPAGQAGDA